VHPAVADAAVVGRPDEEADEVPVAYVVLRSPVTSAQLMAWVEDRVAPYKRLADVVTVDELPRSPTGKLLRRILLERERAVLTR
jgi:acyl-coenzyme A synthetase/AMP-(fatty) acid ligase